MRIMYGILSLNKHSKSKSKSLLRPSDNGIWYSGSSSQLAKIHGGSA